MNPSPDTYLRYPLATRILHWLAAASIFVLLWSGIWILNIHPRLYWGDVGYFGAPAVAEIAGDTSTDPPTMTLKIGGASFDVTGIIGRVNRLPYVRIANYPEGFQFGGNRALHFTAAWVFVIAWIYYISHLLSSGRLRDTWLPSPGELKPANIGHDILNHLKLKRARGEEARRYNSLQKLSYLSVMVILIPLIILTGLTMSNSVTTAWPFLFDLFGGRQSARTLHFVFISLLTLFIIIHIFQLFVAGFINHFRSMITGYYKLGGDRHG
ncbi:MAG: cytochrome b/b6 domain-containing protein [Pseudomonadales bacterium]|nr:cytochrome b/b6 domain-containing protein [Pseudomonadales bacterium]